MNPIDNETARRHAREIFDDAIAAVAPGPAVRANLRMSADGTSLIVGADRVVPLASGARIVVVGAGKATAAMASAAEDVLGDRLSGGVVSVKYDHGLPLRRVELREAAHPVPDQAGVDAGSAIVEALSGLTADDVVVCLLSGGGSALLVKPADGLTLDDLRAVNDALLRCGATIHEINSVRKHLSAVKGGLLARIAAPARVVSLILSDVVGDDLDVIASGPTVGDRSTFADARSVLERYALLDTIPAPVRDRILGGVEGRIEDTPEPGDPLFERVHPIIVAANRVALEAARARAEALGYAAIIVAADEEGDAREIARKHAAIARRCAATGEPAPAPACLLSGGETTVRVVGDGKGGRNMDLALTAAVELAGISGVVAISGGTDGTDGPTDAGGAVIDPTTLARAAALGLDPADYLERNDSYHFFEALGDLLMTGPTGTNVMDIRAFLVGQPG